ncbi:hypothetical protein Hdeb2414_s0189g00827701 [Helianthus debilis subsp. tardiflorus]
MQKKSKNDHWALARKVVFQCDQQKQNDCLHLQHNDSCSKSRYVVESPTLSGVSSILQRWKDLDEVKNSNEMEKNLLATMAIPDQHVRIIKTTLHITLQLQAPLKILMPIWNLIKQVSQGGFHVRFRAAIARIQTPMVRKRRRFGW